MERNRLVYYPHSSAQYACLLAIVFAVVLSFLSGFSFTIPESRTGAVFCLSLSALSLCCAYFAYISSRILVVIQESGIEIVHRDKRQCKFYPWDMFSYSYHCRSYKGFDHLVLSTVVLDDKKLRKLVNQSMNLGRLCFDNCLILCLEQGQKSEMLEAIIKDKAPGKGGL